MVRTSVLQSVILSSILVSNHNTNFKNRIHSWIRSAKGIVWRKSRQVFLVCSKVRHLAFIFVSKAGDGIKQSARRGNLVSQKTSNQSMS